MKMRTIVFRTKQFTATAIFALAMLSAFAGGRPALAGVATGEDAFNKGDFTAAAREFQGPAYRGDALAQYYLGVIHADGLGVSQSPEEGLAWLMCVEKGAGLPEVLRKDAEQKQAHILSRISPYALEQAQMRASTICGIAIKAKQEPFAKEERNPEDIRPARGFLGGIFFFPGDTMVTGAAVVFHELGLTFLENAPIGFANLFGDLLFGILALLGWFVIGRVLHFFFQPLWRTIIAREASTRGDAGGPVHGRAQESEQD